MRGSLRQLFESVIGSLDPAACVSAYLQEHPLGPGAVTVLALGKAAVPMMRGAQAVLGERIQAEIVVAPRIETGSPVGWMESDHPVPSQRSEVAARALLRAASDAEGPVLALVSGGGSALASLPARGLTLAAKSDLLKRVYAAGADISELNIVRKHLSAIKGGRLAAASSHAVTTLVVSDVVGDSLSSIASGPTIPDPSSFKHALDIVHRFLGSGAEGQAALHLERGARGLHEETPKSPRGGDTAVLLAGIHSLVEHAEGSALKEGLTIRTSSPILDGTVQEVLERICAEVLAPDVGTGLWAFGGEASIVLPEQPGVGGRAQHLALLLAERISGRDDIEILVAGSDGADGNSGAAGAQVRGGTWRALHEAGIDPRQALDAFDSATALGAIGAQIVTGPTGVNHADLVLVQIY